MTLQLDSLEKSIAALREALETEARFAGAQDVALANTLRAGVVQGFEVAYEQSWKMLQRWLRENHGPELEEQVRTRRDLFRQGARAGLIADPEAWFGYGQTRNLTAHTYDVAVATSVSAVARRFLADAQALLAALEAHHD
jgi:nucleotidyltransferase substrate binding protein (TIGR01987 family)